MLCRRRKRFSAVKCFQLRQVGASSSCGTLHKYLPWAEVVVVTILEKCNQKIVVSILSCFRNDMDSPRSLLPVHFYEKGPGV